MTATGHRRVTPLVVSVDGEVTVAGNDGTYEVVEDTRDDYPSRGIYYYTPDGDMQVVDEADERRVDCGALPFEPFWC